VRPTDWPAWLALVAVIVLVLLSVLIWAGVVKA